MKNTTHFIITGGTIDSYYNGVHDSVTPSETSVIPEFIASLKLYHDAQFTTVCMKDSRNLNQDDLNNILTTVEESPATKIIVTHGTYTMPDTAKYLKANLQRKDQVIIFTGSTIPIKGFSPSDGTFNLGYALAEADHLAPGIYVCMNGKVFNPDEVIKLLYEGRFMSVFNQDMNREKSDNGTN